MLDEEKLMQEFAIEGQSHVEKIEATLLEIEAGQQGSSLINVLFRSAHSIKGTAGFFGLHKIVELSHSMENLLSKVRSNEMIIDSKMIDVLLKANDKLGVMFEKIANSEQVDSTFHIQALARFGSVSQHKHNTDHMDSLKIARTESLQDKILKSSSSEKYKTVIVDLLKRGHKLYKVSFQINKDIADQDSIQTNISKKINSVGHMISCYRDQIYDSKWPEATGEFQMVFLFSTVLEKKLAIMSLDVRDAGLIQLDDTLDETELFKILLDGERGQGQQLQGEPLVASKEAEVSEQSGKNNTHNGKEEERIRVNLGLLDTLVDLSGEMVLARNQLVRILDPHVDKIPGIAAVLHNIDDMTTQMQQKIMRTRLQTLANLFNVMPRIVRELAKNLGKNINLSIEGKAVEMDKSMIEGLSDPLTHLLRNALDHGVETSSVRQKIGKPPIGQVLIKAYHEGGRVVIDIIDDGAGIDLEKIKATAIERGLISNEQLVYISQQELLNVIFLPGFSTTKGVTDISGRGVGLDVAKANIEKIGGTIEVYTAWGKGTTFRLLLPLTLAIIPSLIIEVAGQKFALPQVNVQEILRIVPGQGGGIQRIQGHQVLRLRDKLVPVVYLADILGLPIGPKGCNHIERVLILKKKAKVFALIVDGIHDQEEILVKALPRHLKGTKGYSGLTILGDGKVAMVLDTDNIGTAGKLILAEEHIQGLSIQEGSISSKGERQELLLFNCSGPEIFGLNLGMIARVDELYTSNIQVVGDQEYMNVRGKVLRLIRLADYLPVAQVQTEGKKLYVIIPKMVKNPMGIIVEKIQDTVEVELNVDAQGLKVPGIFGSIIVNDRIILLLNLYELFDIVAPESFAIMNRRKMENNEKRILLIEDTIFFATLGKHYLEWAGYHVLTATNGREALSILRQYTVDIVLSDIDMPLMDGITLVKTIRADEQLAKLPVIALTSSLVSKGQETLLMEAGFDACECKFDRAHLLGKIVTVEQQRGGELL